MSDMGMKDIQQIIAALRERQPGLRVTQLVVKHTGDDDGLWFVSDASGVERCQIASSSHSLPFLIEGNDSAWVAITCDEVLEVVEALATRVNTSALARTRVRPVASPEEAITWLAARGAHPWLVRHHELVLEAARELLDDASAAFSLRVNRDFVLVGAALHDAGKMVHPSEMSAPGDLHEEAGRALLICAGVHRVSRVAVTHARWSAPGTTLEDRFVALADKLWKGKREPALEEAVIDEVARTSGRDRWDVFTELDAIFERIADGAPERLARSVV